MMTLLLLPLFHFHYADACLIDARYRYAMILRERRCDIAPLLMPLALSRRCRAIAADADAAAFIFSSCRFL